jgi:Protein of unknown function (DUF2911)
MRKTILITLLAAGAAVAAFAQQAPPAFPTPRPSPKASVMQTVGLTDVTITYSRPAVQKREIWGKLVPYDKVWRTGANEATVFTVSDDVTINGAPLPKGTYSLHTIPGKDEWTLIFNKTADQWGSFSYDATKDALRVKAKPEPAGFTEWLTFEIPEITLKNFSARVVLRWENLAVPFTIGTDTAARVMEKAKSAVAAAAATDWQTPNRAATFALTVNDTADAMKWVDQSLKVNENINNLYLKARIQAASGNKAEATKTARAAIAKATDKDKEEVGEIEKSITTWK